MFIAWRDLLHARGRFALIAGVITLIALLVGMLSGLTAGLSRDSTSAVTSLRTNYVTFSGDEPSFSTSRVPVGAHEAGTSPLGFATTRATKGSQMIAATAGGTRPDSTVTPHAAGIARGVVVLTRSAADGLEAVRGDRIEIAGRPFVVGAVRGAESLAHSPMIWMTLGDWQQAMGAGDTATVLARSTDVATPGYTTIPLGEAVNAIASHKSENGSLQLIRGFLFGISALVIGAFFTVWTAQRSRDIAVLKAVGASTRYLLKDAIGQAVALLLVGTVLGATFVWLGSLLAAGRVPFVFDLSTIAIPLLVMDLVGIAGAALAVRQVTSINPLTALGGTR